MTKIVPFIRKSDNPVKDNTISFLDDGTLLDFSTAHKGSVAPVMAQNYSTATCSDWTNQELADLFRAFNLVKAVQSNLEYDRGISDEGSPWFLILNLEGEVLVHICRIDDEYILDSVSIGQILIARDFSSLVDNFLSRSILDCNKRMGKVVELTPGGKIYLHPSMMLAALLWTLLQHADHLETNEVRIPSLSLPEINFSDGKLQAISEQSFDDVTAVKPGLTINLKGVEFDAVGSVDKSSYLHLTGFAQALSTIIIASGLYAVSNSFDVFWVPSIEGSALIDPMNDGAVFVENKITISSFERSPLGNLFSDAAVAQSAHADFPVLEETSADFPILKPLKTVENELVGKLRNFDDILFEGRDLINEKSADQKTMSSFSDVVNGGGRDHGSEFASLSTNQNGSKFYSLVGSSFHSFVSSISDLPAKVAFYETPFFSEITEEKLGDTHELISLALLEVEDLPEVPIGHSIGIDSPSEQLQLKFNLFDKSAQAFVDALIQDATMEILVFEREIILLDMAALSGNASSLSWQFEDGSMISVIGLSSDLAAFDNYI